MPARTSIRPPVSGAPIVVTASSLQEAYRLVRRDFGEDAVILGTRSVQQRQEHGLGLERRIEVTVQGTGGPVVRTTTAASRIAASDRTPHQRALPPHEEIFREVARIEELVAAIAADQARTGSGQRPRPGNPLAETLIENGAASDAVANVLNRFSGETGAAADDRPAAVAWLGENLRAGNGDWEGFRGCHAFLGEAGSGRTAVVLAAAARLQALKRRTLVLSLLPPATGSVRGLQQAAAAGDFDAAVIQDPDRLSGVDDHLGDYDAVLLDLPHLRHAALTEDGPVHAWLARHEGFHRHLLIPLDRDPREMGPLRTAARTWNCDWIVLSRADLSDRPGKILDVLEAVPLPVSLVGRDPGGTGGLEVARSDQLLDAILTPAVADEFEPGLPAARAAAAGAEPTD